MTRRTAVGAWSECEAPTLPHARPNASAHSFVKAPVLAYKPKKGGETDLEIAPILERGMRYIAEFASADSSEA